MPDVNNVNNSSPVLDQYNIDNRTQEEPSSNELGRNEFLELMIAQMENQDPLEPQDNGAFVAELAQFSTVEGIERMASGFDDLSASFRSSQTLEATTLVGASVTLDGQSSSDLTWGDVVFGKAEVPAGSDNLVLTIEDADGNPVERIDLGYREAGSLGIKWDGMNLEVGGELVDIDYEKFEKDDDGNPIPHPEGSYSFRVSGNVAGSSNVEAMEMSMSSRVDSVSINADNSVTLNLSSGGQAGISDIKEINDVS